VDSIFVDLDGTLTQKPSLELRFFRYLRQRKVIGPRQFIAIMLFFLRWGYKSDVAQLNKGYLYKLDLKAAAEYAEEFVAEEFSKIFNAHVMDFVNSIKTSETRLVLLTGCLKILAQPIADRYHFDDLISTLPIIKKNYFGFGLPTMHPFKNRKVLYAQQYCDKYHLNLKNCAAICDSKNDIPLLKQVGLPVVTSPDKELLQTAIKLKWTIL